jgi:carboxylate-amine ligase
VHIHEEVGQVFAHSEDLTIGIEEEFQILDEESLALCDRFGQLKEISDARFGGPLVIGELIQSEAEINTARCTSFSEARSDLLVRRRVLMEAAREAGLKLCSTGIHPFSLWEDQTFIETPHYSQVLEMLRYVAWINNTFGLHVHVGVNGPDRAIAVCDAVRSLLPPLLALSASSPFYRGRDTGLHSTRAQVFIRSFPRCGIPDRYGSWEAYADYAQLLYEMGSVTEATQFWWTVRPHHVYGTVEVRIADAQPRFVDSMAIAGLVVAIVASLMERYDREGSLPSHASRFIEENRWRALRDGLDGMLIDLDRRVEVPATEVLRRLVASVEGTAAALGLEEELTAVEHVLKEGNSAQRQLRLHREGDSIFAIHSRMVEETMTSVS